MLLGETRCTTCYNARQLDSSVNTIASRLHSRGEKENGGLGALLAGSQNLSLYCLSGIFSWKVGHVTPYIISFFLCCSYFP